MPLKQHRAHPGKSKKSHTKAIINLFKFCIFSLISSAVSREQWKASAATCIVMLFVQQDAEHMNFQSFELQQFAEF